MLRSSGGENAGPVNWDMATDIARKEIVEERRPIGPGRPSSEPSRKRWSWRTWLDPRPSSRRLLQVGQSLEPRLMARDDARVEKFITPIAEQDANHDADR